MHSPYGAFLYYVTKYTMVERQHNVVPSSLAHVSDCTVHSQCSSTPGFLFEGKVGAGIASSSDGAGGAMTFAHQADLNPQKTVKKRECICTIWNADPAMHTASRTGL